MSHKIPSGWTSKPLGELFDFKNGFNADKTMYGRGKKFINVMEVINNHYLQKKDIPGQVDIPDDAFSLYSVIKGDVLFNRTSETADEIGLTAVYLDEEPVTFGGFVIRARPLDKTLNQDFCKYCFLSKNVRKEIIKRGQGAIRANIGQGDLSDVQLPIPTSAEQEKIAKILSVWDEAIDKASILIAKVEMRLKGLVNREVYNVTKSNTSPISNLFESISVRGKSTKEKLPVLSVTQKNGIILRSESGRNIKTISDDTSNYKIIRRGDYVLSLRSFEGGIEYSYMDGLISPAYTVLKPKNNLNKEFYKFYFKSAAFLTALAPAIIGIRDGKQIDMEVFWDIPIPVPTDKDGQKISHLWCSYEKYLSTLSTYRMNLKNQKSELMQQLLTGKIRVKVD